MASVTAQVQISAPPEAVFALVADPDERLRLLPDNFVDARVLNGTGGPGTRSVFSVMTTEGAYPTEIEVVRWSPPHELVERAAEPNAYEMTWRFSAHVEGCTASLVSRYEVRGSPFHRLIDRLFARKAVEASLLVELYRLKRRAEGDKP